MIYGAQQTIKLIRLCVFPEEGLVGGYGSSFPAPSLVETPAKVKLPPCTWGHCSFWPTGPSCPELCSLALPWRPRGGHAGSMSLCQQDFGSPPPPSSFPMKPKPEEGEQLHYKTWRGCLGGSQLFTHTPPYTYTHIGVSAQWRICNQQEVWLGTLKYAKEMNQEHLLLLVVYKVNKAE